ncbi:uncharacterized protein LOC124136261 [Haliotis rufescens]|uniref:uncharacterized protein LOC124136261 n=1 Tax=Haliotis rufescens TaxID=6454 RepID=UPI00201F273D|nr:uncharacterized protein LOC124136261 [Haliotis rufescens]
MLKWLCCVTFLQFVTLGEASTNCTAPCTKCIPGTCIEEWPIIAASAVFVPSFVIAVIIICGICGRRQSTARPRNHGGPTGTLPPARSAVPAMSVNVTVAENVHYGSSTPAMKAPAVPASRDATLYRDASMNQEYCTMETHTTRKTSHVNSQYEELKFD